MWLARLNNRCSTIDNAAFQNDDLPGSAGSYTSQQDADIAAVRQVADAAHEAAGISFSRALSPGSRAKLTGPPYP